MNRLTSLQLYLAHIFYQGTSRKTRLAIYRQWNDSSIIFSLPVEIISKISLLAVSESQSGEILHNEAKWNWLWIGYICHRWREIILDLPALWSLIHLHNCDSIAESLRRSKNSPLTLHVSLSDIRVFSSLFAVIPSELRRVKDLCLEGRNASVGAFIDIAQKTPAPLLETLEVQPYDRFILPRVMFGGVSPRLCTLSLSRCQVSSVSSLFLNITRLKLDEVTFRPSTSDASNVLNLLRRIAPTIEELDIRWGDELFIPGEPFTHPQSRTVTLPNLSTFRLWACAHTASFFLPHITLVQLVRLEATLTFERVEDLSPSIRWIAANVEIHRQFHNQLNAGVNLYLARQSESVLEFNLSSTTHMSVSFSAVSRIPGQGPSLITACEAALLEACPLHDINHLSLLRPPSSAIDWKLHYGKMQFVNQVQLSYDSASPSGWSSFLQVLTTNIHLHSNGPVEAIGELFMPHLFTVRLDRTDLDSRDDKGRLLSDMLVACMKIRRALGVPVDKLELVESRSVISKGILQKLREQVCEVVVREDSNSKKTKERCERCKNRKGAKLYLCKGCKCTHYCSYACQKRDWKEHKAQCKSSASWKVFR